MKVEVAVLGSPSLITVLTVSKDVKQNLRKKKKKELEEEEERKKLDPCGDSSRRQRPLRLLF